MLRRASKPTVLPLLPKVKDSQRSGFRAILKLLPLAPSARVLDVGAGGFAGATTTVHLVDLFDTRIEAVEYDRSLADAVAAKFGDRIDVTCADAQAVDLEGEYDLIVADLDSGSVPLELGGLLHSLGGHLRAGGFYVCMFVYDLDAADHPDILPGASANLAPFYEGTFGTRKPSAGELEPFAAEHGFRFCGVVDKWLGEGRALAMGWLVLQKLGADDNHSATRATM